MSPRRRTEPRRFRAESRAEWRAWLERHHATEREVWLVYAKKRSGKPTVRYAEAVEEAICFGWIDTTVHPVDESFYQQKFTPRTNSKNWSKINLDRFDRMVKEGRMTDAGRAKRPADVAPPAARLHVRDPVPPFILRALAAHPAARNFFQELAPTYRRDYVRWIVEAKKPETRQRRLEEAIRRLEAKRRRAHDPASEPKPLSGSPKRPGRPRKR
jgi:uncharacterized protein YdeI (YjbR/CyaY-like superfamily)